MIEIAGGTFTMGYDGPLSNPSERPTHTVTVSTFHLDRTEVTVAAYAECVRAGACSEPDSYADERGTRRPFCNWKHPEGRWTHPINCVDFVQASAFCSWRNERLPTEQEWEHAARGGEGRMYPWGDAAPDETRLNACGTECPANAIAKGLPGWPPMYQGSDGWPETAPVGSYPAGASKGGVLDLAGNVWEWTASEYMTYDGRPADRPGERRVLRGGSWGGADPRTERTTNRFGLPTASRAQFLGFRCAK
jgi:formylglycine-generating enzyme